MMNGVSPEEPLTILASLCRSAAAHPATLISLLLALLPLYGRTLQICKTPNPVPLYAHAGMHWSLRHDGG